MAKAAASLEFSTYAIFMQNVSAWGQRVEKKIDSLKDGPAAFPETHFGLEGTNDILEYMSSKG